MAKIVNISQSTKYSTIIFCLPRTLGTVGTWDSRTEGRVSDILMSDGRRKK